MVPPRQLREGGDVTRALVYCCHFEGGVAGQVIQLFGVTQDTPFSISVSAAVQVLGAQILGIHVSSLVFSTQIVAFSLQHRS